MGEKEEKVPLRFAFLSLVLDLNFPPFLSSSSSPPKLEAEMSFALKSALPKAARPAFARGYAVPSSSFQVADAAGIKVATSQSGLPTSSLSVVVKAGSRYEPAPGVAHVLKDSLFKVRSSPLVSPHLVPEIDTQECTDELLLIHLRSLIGDQQAQPDPAGSRD